ncbi:hypothetical protein D3C81_1941170 [compost metagenome]
MEYRPSSDLGASVGAAVAAASVADAVAEGSAASLLPEPQAVTASIRTSIKVKSIVLPDFLFLILFLPPLLSFSLSCVRRTLQRLTNIIYTQHQHQDQQ